MLEKETLIRKGTDVEVRGQHDVSDRRIANAHFIEGVTCVNCVLKSLVPRRAHVISIELLFEGAEKIDLLGDVDFSCGYLGSILQSVTNLPNS